MKATGTTATLLTSQEPMKEQFCPECGAIMVEEDRFRENDFLFIWYKCSKSDCDGKWLSRKESTT